MTIVDTEIKVKQYLEEIRNRKETNPYYCPEGMNISVFLSSTKDDMELERQAVSSALEIFGYTVNNMESFGANTEPPYETCLHNLSKSDIYVGILKMRYGSLFPPESDSGPTKQISYTEKEYEKAVEKNMRILIYLINEKDGEVQPKDVDFKYHQKLTDFKKKLKTNHTVATYINARDLCESVSHDVYRDTLLLKSVNGQPELQHNNSKDITLITDKDQYYLFETIRILGTIKKEKCLGSTIYLYLIKDTIPSSGTVKILPEQYIPLGENEDKGLPIQVNNNGDWEGMINLSKQWAKIKDTDTYTILAGPKNIESENGRGISPSTNQFASKIISLNKAFLTAQASSSTFIQDAPFTISGTAEGRSPRLYAWTISMGQFVSRETIQINKDRTYSYEFSNFTVKKLHTGEQYFCILQMPAGDSTDDVMVSSEDDEKITISEVDDNGSTTSNTFQIINNNDAKLLEVIPEFLNRKKRSDLYVKLTFSYDRPEISKVCINSNTLICDTNIPAGTQISVRFVVGRESLFGRRNIVQVVKNNLLQQIIYHIRQGEVFHLCRDGEVANAGIELSIYPAGKIIRIVDIVITR